MSEEETKASGRLNQAFLFFIMIVSILDTGLSFGISLA